MTHTGFATHSTNHWPNLLSFVFQLIKVYSTWLANSQETPTVKSLHVSPNSISYYHIQDRFGWLQHLGSQLFVPVKLFLPHSHPILDFSLPIFAQDTQDPNLLPAHSIQPFILHDFGLHQYFHHLSLEYFWDFLLEAF